MRLQKIVSNYYLICVPPFFKGTEARERRLLQQCPIRPLRNADLGPECAEALHAHVLSRGIES